MELRDRDVVMELLRTWVIGLAAALLLVLLGRLARRRGLSRPPLVVPLVATAVWTLLRSLPLGALPPTTRLWLSSLDDLLVVYAAIQLVIWGCLEVPGSLGWWPRPPKLLLQLLALGACTIGTVVVIRQATRFDLVGLITTSAVLTAVIGLAAQEPLKDLLAGLELQLTSDFELGDFIHLNDEVRGVVVSVSWRDTTLRNIDGALVLVPNTEVTQGVVYNLSALGPVSNRFSIGLDYDFPPGQARELLERVARQHPRVLADPAPSIRVKSFDDSSIAYEIQVWQKELGDRALMEIRSDLHEQIWYALRRVGQSIPFPIRELQRRGSSPKATLHQGLSPGDIRGALSRSSVFACLSEEQLHRLVDGSLLAWFGSGEAIVEEGSEGDSLFFLLRGRVEVLKAVAPDRVVSVTELGPGQLIGEMTLFLDTPRSATVRAVEECLLLQVRRNCVGSLIERNPDLLDRFAAIVSAREAELANLDHSSQPLQSNLLLETMKRLVEVFKGG